MKKLLSIIIVIALASPFFTSCKKGENDPGLSLKSRTARLVGEWSLTDWTKTETTTSTSGTDITSYAFSGTNLTRTTSGGSTVYVYSETSEIMKDGTYKFNSSQTDTEASTTTMVSNEGTWMWVAGNKEDDLKNKERVCFTTTKSTSTSGTSSYTYTYDGDKDGDISRIDKLSGKELIIDTKTTMTQPDWNGGLETTVVEETKTYEKQ